jgi:hypothetical protein
MQLEVFNMRLSNSSSRTQYEVRYQPLIEGVTPLSFPCDAEGHVQLDALSDSARESYLYARAVVGREYAAPAVLPCEAH